MSRQDSVPAEESWDPVWSREQVQKLRRQVEAMGLRHLAPDMIQDTALALCRAGQLVVGQGMQASNPTALAYKVLHNLCVNTCRRNELLPTPATDVGGLVVETEPTPSPNRGPGREDLLRLLSVVEPYLTARERDLYVHTTRGHATLEALARSLDLSKGWVHECFSGLLTKLRKLLGEEGLGPAGAGEDAAV